MSKAKKMRIDIPRNPEDLLLLAGKVYTKHLAEAANSPLKTMQDHSWTTDGPTVATALDLHN
jgi:hypothetical protein